jgi:L-asparaginase
VVSLGGTIAMTNTGAPGVTPSLSGEDLLAAVPAIAQAAEVSAVQFRQVPGAHLTIEDLVALAERIREVVAEGADGVVVTQGTDTIEEVAFGLDLLIEGDAPVVVTGAMRNPTLPGADGPANLLAAVQVAAAPQARGNGTLVVLNDQIHAARFVRKTHTANPAAFQSPTVGPIGWVADGVPRIPVGVVERRHVPVSAAARPSAVALVTLTLGDDGRLLSALEQLEYAGVVVEALGGGHAPAVMVDALERLASRMPVVLASRAGAGEVLRGTYGFPGSETDLLGRGLIRAGALDGRKARLLLTLLLRAGVPREEIARTFAAW